MVTGKTSGLEDCTLRAEKPFQVKRKPSRLKENPEGYFEKGTAPGALTIDYRLLTIDH
jgi:hypothetical protein